MTVARNGNCIWTREVKRQDYEIFQLIPFFFLRMVFLVFIFMMLAANRFPVVIWIRLNRSEPFGHSDSLGNPYYWCHEFLSWYRTEMWTYCTGFCFISLCRRKKLEVSWILKYEERHMQGFWWSGGNFTSSVFESLNIFKCALEITKCQVKCCRIKLHLPSSVKLLIIPGFFLFVFFFQLL